MSTSIRGMQSLLFGITMFLIWPATLSAQFSRADSLRGALRPERTSYDVTFYDLDIKVDPATKRIEGSNTMRFRVLEDLESLQIDLFSNMQITGIERQGKALAFRRDENAVFVDFDSKLKASSLDEIKVFYHGVPTEAKRAPWDGGFVWKQDPSGRPWVGVACEGTGASLWWPCKDHLGDEPDSMLITVKAPIGLKAVANGILRSAKDIDNQWTAWEWFVSYPINSYNVTVNIADYAHIHDNYANASGIHDLDYYVLKHNEEKAKVHFAQVKQMMEIFEKAFGEYPFWKDGYALVETYYLGMEHQGAIAYGNHYLKGYDGYDPLNLEFDYIIIHETGHEWWGNSVSCKDHAELWIHESFCTYSEAVYVEARWGKDVATKYLLNQKSNILNATPIVGPLHVNFNDWAGSDMYYKGAWMLHTLRNAVNDDGLWWNTIRNFALDFRLKNTDTPEIIAYFNQKLGKDYTWLFKEYLYVAAAPVLEYKAKKKKAGTEVSCRWTTKNKDFALKVPILGGKSPVMIAPTTEWQKFFVDVPLDQFKFDYSTWYGKTRNVGK